MKLQALTKRKLYVTGKTWGLGFSLTLRMQQIPANHMIEKEMGMKQIQKKLGRIIHYLQSRMVQQVMIIDFVVIRFHVLSYSFMTSHNTSIFAGNTSRRQHRIWCIILVLAVVEVLYAIVCASGLVAFFLSYPIEGEAVAIGGNVSVSLVEQGFSSFLTKSIEITLAEDVPPTSFFMAECSQVETTRIALPKKLASPITEDEFDTTVQLNYFRTDLPIYSAGPLQISYNVTANSSVQYSPTDSCPLQLFLFDDNSTFQQAQVDSTVRPSEYIDKSPCLLNASLGSSYPNQTSQTIFPMEQEDQPHFYFVLAYVRKGVRMTAEIEVNLTVYDTSGLFPMSCPDDTFLNPCGFNVSNHTLNLSNKKICLFAESVDDVTPPYFTVSISSNVNIVASLVFLLSLAVLGNIVVVCVIVATVFYCRKR